MSESYRSEDVFWAPDPFRRGSNPRLWLVLASEDLPYPDEEYVCAALTTSDLPENYEIGDAWVNGRDPTKTSYCSPWVLATIKDRAVVDPQGSVTAEFTQRMTERAKTFLDG